MEQFEMVRKGLSYCNPNNTTCYEKRCPYYDHPRCIDALINDTLILLQQQNKRIKELEAAQTPRILTMEEVRNGTVQTGWLEDFDKCEVIPAIRFTAIDSKDDETVGFHIMDGFIAAPLTCYGEIWRCWDKKPGNEQRLTTPWKR